MIRVPENVRFAEERDGAVLLDIANDRFFDLNATGAAIWRYVTADISPCEIVNLLAAEAGEEQATIQTSVDEFLQSLVGLNLIAIDGDTLAVRGASNA